MCCTMKLHFSILKAKYLYTFFNHLIVFILYLYRCIGYNKLKTLDTIGNCKDQSSHLVYISQHKHYAQNNKPV